MAKSEAQCQFLFDSLPLRAKQVLASIIWEYNSACEIHPKWPTSVIDQDSDTPRRVGDFVHAAAIVAKESGELVRAALNNHYEDGLYYEMHKEALQTGAMALRFLINS